MRPRQLVYPGKLLAAGIAHEVFDLPFPPEALIKEIRVKQASGALVGFSVDVYSSGLLVPGGESSAVADSSAIVADPDLYKVVPTFSATSGNIARFTSTDNGAVYKNAESQPANPIYKIWFVIIPSAPGLSTWDISIDAMLNR